MRTITFTRDVTYETQGRHKGTEFKRGQVVRDCSVDFADRWIRRDAAVDGEVAFEDEAKPAVDPLTPARQPDADKVQIPDNYTELKADEMKALAGSLSTAQPRTKAEAIAIVEAELELRTKPPAQ